MRESLRRASRASLITLSGRERSALLRPPGSVRSPRFLGRDSVSAGPNSPQAPVKCRCRVGGAPFAQWQGRESNGQEARHLGPLVRECGVSVCGCVCVGPGRAAAATAVLTAVLRLIDPTLFSGA